MFEKKATLVLKEDLKVNPSTIKNSENQNKILQ